jgi:hypothetical protein
VLGSRGLENGLIEVLLRDARLWGWLSSLLEEQVTILRESFETKNWAVLFEQDDSGQSQHLKHKTDEMAKQLREKLKNLTALSQELIQLVGCASFGERNLLT